MGHANEHGIKPIKKNERRERERGGDGWEGAQKKKSSRAYGVGCMHMWCMCALSSWNSSTVECRIALYSPPVKTVDAHLGDVWFGSSHLADWGISCYAAMPKHSSNAMLNAEHILLSGRHTEDPFVNMSVKKLTELWGNVVWYLNQEGLWSNFWFILIYWNVNRVLNGNLQPCVSYVKFNKFICNYWKCIIDVH